jgi:beta-phosphoglucomutase-like phosphatase (HAD superfamily)
MITCDDVCNGKPDPEPYKKGAALLGVASGNCVVFEDAPAGVRAGKAAGALVVALRTTCTDRELEDAGVDWIVDGYHQITLSQDDHGSGTLRLLLEL